MAHQIAARVQNRTDKEPMRVGRTVTREHLPTGLDHRKCVKAFFNYIHEAYPVFDRTKVTAEAEQYFMAAAKPGSIPCANVPVKLYMIIVIGCAALCSVRKLPEDMAERVFVPYQEIMNDCLMLPSVETIENLLLLALYSIYDPLGVSPWTLTGVLGRQAIAIGLNRKCRIVGDEGGGASAADDNSNGPAVMATTGLEAEHRHRLFWAIYQFDRMIAAAFGLPFVIDDQSINVPLPGITVEEFASSERIHYTRVLQVSRNSIGLRNLEGRVFQQVHLGNSPTTSSTSTGPSISISTSSLTYIDRRAILEDFRSRIDDWYAQRCLLSRLEKDNVEFLNTIGWLNLRYYSLLALLYCPSDFNSQLSSGQVSDLHRTIEQYIYYCAVLFQQQHFPLTYITLNRLLLVLLILLFCIDSSSHPGDVKGGRIDAHVVISLCIPILEAFPDRWSSAKRMLVLFRRLDCVPQLGQPPDHGSATNSTMFDETLPLASSAMGAGSYQQAEASRKGSVGQGVTFEDGLERIKNDAFALSQEILGPSSVYNNFS
ncbi:hypothetical protein A1O3_03789 [Capronia epimyces CBS 606.96]|uniref:Xylanolytic transcriptional activator regulatory domain-containing protein n=1 Tax=Capronia epimyces CBS 606.96 TaxID=1182542 RepID=W9YB37_9EURO|nr:uncharacterized protein A1O3_03789 [Capronia epimyces CBS 606.96]EXJ86835.1 hypothetical protein A1O3_03789 [Capronia epimyces CBS 606.96]